MHHNKYKRGRAKTLTHINIDEFKEVDSMEYLQ